MTEWRASAANASKGIVAAAEHRREQVVETGSSAALTPRFTCKRAAPEEGERPPPPYLSIAGHWCFLLPGRTGVSVHELGFSAGS